MLGTEVFSIRFGALHFVGGLAMFLLAAAGLFALTNRRLRRIVEHRTAELTAKNVLLEQQAAELRNAQNDLREKQGYLQRVVNSDLIGVLFWDSTGGISEPNDVYLEMLGYTRAEFEAAPLRFHDFTPPEYRAADENALKALAQSGRCVPFEKEYIRKDGKRIWVIVGAATLGDPHRGVAFVLDITEQKRIAQRLTESEEQLRQSQKMEAMGRLAGGIAHDFNNLLTVINGYSTMLLNRSDNLEEPAIRAIDEIHRAGSSAAKLTHQLLAFSRQQVLAPKIVDLNSVVEEMSVFLERLLGERIRLCVHLEPAVGSIRADSVQLQQVIMNLAVNARDSMNGDGVVRITTGKRAIAAGHGSLVDLGTIREPITPGLYAVISVSDTGTGMSPEIMKHLFEPFFTTKQVGCGTGLGLSTVYGIVKQSGGYVTVESTAGKGSTFRVLLPMVSDSVTEDPAVPLTTDMPRGNEAVLVVEDDEFVRNLVRELLMAQGYTVYSAEKAHDAVAMLEQHDRGVDLLVTDVVMPGMSGRDVATKVREICPEIKVLYMSGYTDDAILLHGVQSSELAFLAKPFSLHALAAKVRKVLDNRGAA